MKTPQAISESSSITNEVLQPGNSFWVPSLFGNGSTSSNSAPYPNFFHYIYGPGANTTGSDPQLFYYDIFSDINITDITDAVQGININWEAKINQGVNFISSANRTWEWGESKTKPFFENGTFYAEMVDTTITINDPDNIDYVELVSQG